jgi:hypothetical protein
MERAFLIRVFIALALFIAVLRGQTHNQAAPLTFSVTPAAGQITL